MVGKRNPINDVSKRLNSVYKKASVENREYIVAGEMMLQQSEAAYEKAGRSLRATRNLAWAAVVIAVVLFVGTFILVQILV